MTLSMTSASAAAGLSTIRCIRQDENVGQYIALLRFGMFLKQQLGDVAHIYGRSDPFQQVSEDSKATVPSHKHIMLVSLKRLKTWVASSITST